MIEAKKITVEYLHGRMTNHEQIKDRLIDLIRSAKSYSIRNHSENVSYTDLGFMHETRPWLNLFYENIGDYCSDLAKHQMHHQWDIHACWFFRYLKGEYSEWHTHARCMWTNVYFLQLPSPEMKTSFLNASDGSQIEIDSVKEGDIISFPSSVIHCSKPNLYDKEKIVIAFNLDIKDSTVYKKYPVNS